jgi:hypothetical protein
MTKREKQMQSMLNYYGINTGGTRDEKMTKTEKKSFLDRLNGNYDAHTVHDILGKIRDKFNDKNKDQDEEESDDPFFDSLKKQKDDVNKDFPFPMDMNQFSNKNFGFGSNEMQNFGYMNLNPEIEKFITWISDLLYSADHKVIITEEGNITNVRLEKIKKKRGGRKK